MPEPQTVEDLGKLVKSKYPGSYDSINDIELGQKVRAKYPDAYGHFTDVKPKIQTPPSFSDRARSLLLEGNLSGKYTPFEEKQKKTFEFPPVLEKAAMIGGLAEGGVSLLKNPEPIMNLARAGYQGMKAALPDLLKGGTKAGFGMGGVSALQHTAPGLSHVPIWLGIYPGLKQLGSGIAKGAREFAGEFNPANLGKLITSESTVPEAMGAKTAIPGGYEKLPKIPGMRYGGPVKSPKGLKTSRPIGMSGPPESLPSGEEAEGIVDRPFEKPQGEYLPPGHQAFLETEAPYKPSLSKSQIEASQSTARAAKENTLARHLNDNYPDLSKVPKTSEFLRTVGKDAGLKWEPSLRTLEEAIKKAAMLRINPI